MMAVPVSSTEMVEQQCYSVMTIVANRTLIASQTGVSNCQLLLRRRPPDH